MELTLQDRIAILAMYHNYTIEYCGAEWKLSSLNFETGAVTLKANNQSVQTTADKCKVVVYANSVFVNTPNIVEMKNKALRQEIVRII